MTLKIASCVSDNVTQYLHKIGSFPAEIISSIKRDDPNSFYFYLRELPNVDEADHNGWTLMHFVCHYGTLALLEDLLSWGASTCKTTNKGIPPVYVAALSNKSEILKRLIEEGVPLDYIDKEGRNLLAAATIAKARDAISILKPYFNQ